MNVFSQILNDKNPVNADCSRKEEDSTLDPRPDLASDHKHWEHILANAKSMYNEDKPVNDAGKTSLFKIMHGLRCGGARLEETLQAYKLHPGEEEFVNPQEWVKTKQRWLDPVKDDLVALFKLCKIGQVVNEELPSGLFEGKQQNTQHKAGGQQKIEFPNESIKCR
jgi:hypothetical protein